MDGLEGKVAVITGAGSGLGRAMAHRFGQAGMRLVLADVDESRLNQIGGQLDERGVQVQTLATDVSKLSQVEGLADLAYERFGAVNVLCNNAGVAAVGPAWECTNADWEWAIGVNLWGVVHGLRAFLPRMLESGEPGHVVNTGSVAGILSPPLSSPYVATKHAVVGMTESLYHDLNLRQANISCSVLAPGFVRTRIAASEQARPDELKNPVPSDDPLSNDVGEFYAKAVARRGCGARRDSREALLYFHASGDDAGVRGPLRSPRCGQESQDATVGDVDERRLSRAVSRRASRRPCRCVAWPTRRRVRPLRRTAYGPSTSGPA